MKGEVIGAVQLARGASPGTAVVTCESCGQQVDYYAAARTGWVYVAVRQSLTGSTEEGYHCAACWALEQ